VHDERRIYPEDPVVHAREKLIVERIAARRLIALDRLVEVLCWSRHTEEVAPRSCGLTCQCWWRWFSRLLRKSSSTLMPS
jgi:hypothetical protein